jgi:hypothetical protein
MSLEVIVALAIGVALAIVVIAKLRPAQEPPSPQFTCAKCKTVARHSARTIEAWRKKKTSFYCHACHQIWLQSRPDSQQSSTRYSSSNAGGKSGCLGMLGVGVVLPMCAFWLWSAV